MAADRTSEAMAAGDKAKREELLVFGYACKLFRDDERALLIDRGNHLIPWMADESLKIDRYDGRGTLSDLRPHQAPPGGHDRWQGLTDRQRRLEEALDRERYMALYCDDEEEKVLEDEQWKRLQRMGGGSSSATYNQMAFNYDAAASGPTEPPPPSPPPATAAAAATQPADQPYTVPDTLNLPAGMTQPETQRHADIIERTAHFVARQGPQMEILIKAKQADNAMFDFLSFDDPLQPFFRHMVVMIKAGRYTVGPQTTEKEPDDAYLHPVLNLSRPDIAPGKQDTMYQPSANCAYQLLVKNIRSRQAADSPAGSGTSSPLPAAPPADSQPGSPRQHRQKASPERERPPAGGEEEPAAKTEAEEAPPLPAPDVRVIIDKMASYVAKNGRDFEGIVMGRGDPRFSFLKDSHQHHAYYCYKLHQYERDLGKPVSAKPAAAPEVSGPVSSQTDHLKPGPVSFSIRSNKEKEAMPLERSALPMEESDEEGDVAAAAVAAAPAPAQNNEAVAAPSETCRGDSAKRQSRQMPVVAPAPGVGRDEIQLDRKRRAAQFLAKLRQDVDKIKQPIIGPQLPDGPLPAGSDSDQRPGTPPPPQTPSPSPSPAPSPAPQPPELEDEESDQAADLDKYRLVPSDSESVHSVPEPEPEPEPEPADAPVSRPESAVSPAERPARPPDSPPPQRRSESRRHKKSSGGGRSSSSRRRHRRHRHHHRRRSPSDEPYTRSRSRSRSRSERKHKKRKKRNRTKSPPASYKHVVPEASAAAVDPSSESGRLRRASRSRSLRRQAQPSCSPPPRHSKRKRSPTSKRKHKSKKSKRSKSSRSRQSRPEERESAAREPGHCSSGSDEITELPVTPTAAPPSQVIDLTSPAREFEPSPEEQQWESCEQNQQARSVASSRRSSPEPAATGASTSPAGPRSERSSSASDEEIGARSGSDAERSEQDAAIALLKKKLVRRPVVQQQQEEQQQQRQPNLPSSTLVQQMAEGLRARVAEMVRGSLLSK